MAETAGSDTQEVAQIASDLLQIDTSNPGKPERPAAEYVAAALDDIGLRGEFFEPAPGRTSYVARMPGANHDLPPLLVHAHLDVVPAAAAEWSVDPFSGTVRDGYIWGRGAVDMKGAIAANLAAVRHLHRDGRRPRRDLILAFFADEEAGGELGAGHVTRSRPELFDGCGEAIGEVGGFSYTLPTGIRAYLVASAEKGVFWARMVAHGRPGHGSMINDDNAVTQLGEAVARVAHHQYDSRLTPAVEGFFGKIRELIGTEDVTPTQLLNRIGPLERVIRAGMQDTVNPTRLDAGYKANVVPSQATATIDGRFLPGNRDAFLSAVERAAGDRIMLEPIYTGDAVESNWDTPLVAAMTSALRTRDTSAVVVPYMSTAFTDAKWLSKLGIQCYGFCPLLLPDDLDFTALFHGRDERIPVNALEFSVAVLAELFESY